MPGPIAFAAVIDHAMSHESHLEVLRVHSRYVVYSPHITYVVPLISFRAVEFVVGIIFARSESNVRSVADRAGIAAIRPREAEVQTDVDVGVDVGRWTRSW